MRRRLKDFVRLSIVILIFIAGSQAIAGEDAKTISPREYEVYRALLTQIRSDTSVVARISPPSFRFAVPDTIDQATSESLWVADSIAKAGQSIDTKNSRPCSFFFTNGPNSDCVLNEYTRRELLDSSTFVYFEKYDFTVSNELIEAFNKANEFKCQLDSSQFPSSMRVRILSSQKAEAYRYSDNGFWKSFNDDFPCADGIRSLSRVGFSQDGSLALLELGHGRGRLNGIGHYILLRRVEGTWRIEDKLRSWIS